MGGCNSSTTRTPESSAVGDTAARGDTVGLSKVLLTIGAGPGISAAVARKFGANGYKVALVSLKQEEAEKEKAALKSLGVEAIALQADAADADAVKKAIEAAKALGAITVVHYNAFSVAGGEDPATFLNCCAVGCVGLLTAKNELLPELKAQKGAILVTGSFVAATDLPKEVEETLTALPMWAIAPVRPRRTVSRRRWPSPSQTRASSSARSSWRAA